MLISDDTPIQMETLFEDFASTLHYVTATAIHQTGQQKKYSSQTSLTNYTIHLLVEGMTKHWPASEL